MSTQDFCDNCGIMLPLSSTNTTLCKGCTNQASHHHQECECEFCGKADLRKCTTDLQFYCETPNQHIDSQESSSPEWIPRSERKKKKKITETQIKTDPVDNDLSEVKSTTTFQRPLAESAVKDEILEQWEKEQADYKKQLCKNDTPEITALVGGQRRKPDGSHYYLGGVDISFIKGNETDACACFTVVQMPDLEMVYQRMEMIKLTQPYIPGFLAFREVPPLQQLYETLVKEAPQYTPDVILVDGNGTLHPRGFGLACQLGVVLDRPTIGVAKTLISAQGIVDDDQHKEKKQTLMEAGDGFDLEAESGEILGKCVRVHDNAPNPVFVSVGHKISLESAVWIALECSKCRIPEPVRRADLDSREYLRKNLSEPQVYIKNK